MMIVPRMILILNWLSLWVSPLKISTRTILPTVTFSKTTGWLSLIKVSIDRMFSIKGHSWLISAVFSVHLIHEKPGSQKLDLIMIFLPLKKVVFKNFWSVLSIKIATDNFQIDGGCSSLKVSDFARYLERPKKTKSATSSDFLLW